jgi:biopolymer transport protein ExbB
MNKKTLMGAIVCVAFAMCAVAQQDASGAAAGAAASAPNVNAYGMTFRQAWGYGGLIMWVLAALSIFSLALVFYFLVALRPNAVAPSALLSDILAKIRANDLSEVRRLCEKYPCPLSSVVITSLDCLRNVPNCDVALLRSATEAEGVRQADALQGQTEFLLDVSTISPLLGLLGTVLGMLRAFGSLATDVASAKPVVLAAGVSQGLVTTVFGLVVAIPCMGFYAWFRRRASRQIANLEAAASEVVTTIAGMGGSQASFLSDIRNDKV